MTTGRRAGRRPRPVGPVLLGLLLLGVLLSGCVSPGKEGPVVAGPQAGPALGVDFFPDPPLLDASPERIVRDFVAAAAGFQLNHQTARSFLVSDQASKWRSDKQVTVFPSLGSLQVTMTTLDGVRVKPPAKPPATPTAKATTKPTTKPTTSRPGTSSTAVTTVAGRTATVTVTTPVQAVLDDAGHYTPAAPGKPVAVSFELAKVSGQWRISRLDDGLLIDQQDFEAAFRPYSIYFPDDTGSYLVPDLRWYPLTDGIATTLVQGLLAGPSRWLAPAVSTGAPTGTKLAEPAVVVAEGRAVVDLDEAVYKATSAQRKTLQRQLIETLSQVGGIGDVTVTVKRAAFNVTGAGAVPVDDDPGLRLKRDPKVAPNPLLLDRTGVLARLTGSGLNRTVEPVQQIVALSKRGGGAPAISSDGNAFAVLDHTGAAVWYQLAGAAQAQRLLTGRQLTPPSFDPQGWVWCTSRFSDRAVTAVRPDRDPARVAAAWLAGLQVRQLRVSRDGSRAVLIVLDAAGREQVLGTGIRRSADGSPLELTEPFRLAPELATVSAVAWLDESRVVLLGATAGGGLRTWLSQLGGPTLSTTEQADTEAAGQSEIKDANWIAAGNNQLELYLGTSSGKVLARAGRGWISVAEGRWPTFPG